jgi:ABC-type transport system involved in cytochrome bd biosynthesis fused ATPase/permease subunit
VGSLLSGHFAFHVSYVARIAGCISIKELSLSAAIESNSHAYSLDSLLVLSFQVFRVFVMKFISASTVALGVLLAGSAHAATHKIADDFQGASFFTSFSFYSQPDPTHGRV